MCVKYTDSYFRRMFTIDPLSSSATIKKSEFLGKTSNLGKQKLIVSVEPSRLLFSFFEFRRLWLAEIPLDSSTDSTSQSRSNPAPDFQTDCASSHPGCLVPISPFSVIFHHDSPISLSISSKQKNNSKKAFQNVRFWTLLQNFSQKLPSPQFPQISRKNALFCRFDT